MQLSTQCNQTLYFDVLLIILIRLNYILIISVFKTDLKIQWITILAEGTVEEEFCSWICSFMLCRDLGRWVSGYRVSAGSQATSTQRCWCGHYRKFFLWHIKETGFLKKGNIWNAAFEVSNICSSNCSFFIGRDLSLLFIYTRHPCRK